MISNKMNNMHSILEQLAEGACSKELKHELHVIKGKLGGKQPT